MFVLENLKSERKFKGDSLIAIPDSYTIIDIETTGLDPGWNEIIEIAAIKVVDNKIYSKFQTLVKPIDPINHFIIELTGITNEDLEDAPAIAKVLPDFEKFVNGQILMGHCVHFDINFLYDNFSNYLDQPLTNDFVDTLRLSRRLFKDFKNHKLLTLSENFCTEHRPSHRAETDCLATFDCYNHIKNFIINNGGLDTLFASKSKSSGISAKDIVTENTEFDATHPLFGKYCVFTGKLEKMVRRAAFQMIKDLGGMIQDHVNNETNFLILGNLSYSSAIKDGKSSKLKKAEQLILAGQDLEILSENVFYDLVMDND